MNQKNRALLILVVVCLIASFLSNLHFLKSVYATTNTIGITDILASDDTEATGTMIGQYAGPVTDALGGSLTKITIRCKMATAGNMKAAIYSADKATKLGESNPVAVGTSEAWVDFTLTSPVAVTYNSYYWLEAIADNGYTIKYTTNTSPTYGYKTGISYPTFPSSFTSSANYKLSIYGTYTVAADTTKPTYSNISYSSAWYGTSCIFSCKWTDETALSGYIFGTNNTGTWTNETWTPLSGTVAWANVTKTLNVSIGYVIQFCWWCNDTSNNYNNTGIQFLTTIGWTVTLYNMFFDPLGFSSMWFDCFQFGYNNTLIANDTTLTFANSTTTLLLQAYPVTLGIGNVFNGWIVNGTNMNTIFGAAYDNPITLLVNANYIIIVNITTCPIVISMFSFMNTTSLVNTTLGFDATASWSASGIYSYNWNWGDGITDWGSTVITTHSYTTSGTFNITLMIVTPLSPMSFDYTVPITITEPTPTSFVVWLSTGALLSGISLAGVVLIKRKRS